MGNLNVNFGSGKGTVYSNQNSENSLYSLLKGNQGNSNSGSGSYLLTKEAGTNSTYASQAYRNVVNKIEFPS